MGEEILRIIFTIVLSGVWMVPVILFHDPNRPSRSNRGNIHKVSQDTHSDKTECKCIAKGKPYVVLCKSCREDSERSYLATKQTRY